MFSIWFEALFPHSGALGCVVCFVPPLFLPVYLHANVGLQGPPAAALPQVLSTQLPVSAPPTGLDECVFNSLVVGLLYSLIFCQFWLFFVFKLLLSFFWLCKEAQCVYLCLHLGRKSDQSFFKLRFMQNTGLCGRFVSFSLGSQSMEMFINSRGRS